MPLYDWNTFLTQWSKKVLASAKVKRVLPADVSASKWLGYPGATKDQITQAEARLKTTLPPSYREFLQVTNGWRMIGSPVSKLWSTEEIEWFAVRRPEWAESWVTGQEYDGPSEAILDDEYFVYGEEQDPASLRIEYLHSALEISDIGDSAVYLLNPQVVTPDGEWEAWFLATWLPGAVRYRSFWEMMQTEYQEIVGSIGKKRQPLRGDVFPQVSTFRLSELVEELEHKINQYRSLKDRPNGPSVSQYHQSVIEELQFAEARVREIQKQTSAPPEQRKLLSTLADELERLGQQGIRAAMKGFDLGQIMSKGMGELEKQIQSGGKPVGYQEAASTIRWFLGQK